jgi:hypothetical protein
MKNPALVALIALAVLSALVAVGLLAASASGMTNTWMTDPYTGSTRPVAALPIWVAAIPGLIALAAGIGALVLWGSNRTAAE